MSNFGVSCVGLGTDGVNFKSLFTAVSFYQDSFGSTLSDPHITKSTDQWISDFYGLPRTWLQPQIWMHLHAVKRICNFTGSLKERDKHYDTKEFIAVHIKTVVLTN